MSTPVQQQMTQYMDKFGYSPQPTQLLLFAKQNGVRLMYKNVRQALSTVNVQRKTNEHNLDHIKTVQKKEQIVNEPKLTETAPTKEKTVTNKPNLVKTMPKKEKIANEPNSIETVHKKETKQHQNTVEKNAEPVPQTKDTQNKNDEAPQEYKPREVNDKKFEMVFKIPSASDIIIYLDSSTKRYTIKQCKACLHYKHGVIVMGKFDGFEANDVDYNMMKRFSPLCHKLIIKLKLTKIINIYDRVNTLSLLPHWDKIPHYFKPIPFKRVAGYHSKYNYKDCKQYKVACGVYILPLIKSSISGIAPCSLDNNECDVIGEVLQYFRANILFKCFDIEGAADLILVYLTAYVAHCLRQLQDVENKTDAVAKLNSTSFGKNKCFKIPGDKNFAFDDKCYQFKKPMSSSEKHVFVDYFVQLRYETLKRLIEKCYVNGKQNKHWFQFSKKKFLGISDL